jgi:hypothetical protein
MHIVCSFAAGLIDQYHNIGGNRFSVLAGPGSS